MRPLPGPHHDRPTRPLSEQELVAVGELELRLQATSSRRPLAERCRRLATIVAASVVIVVVLIAAGAVMGPSGVALVSTMLITGVLGMVLRDLLRSAPGPSGA